MRRDLFMGKLTQKSSFKDCKTSTSIWITSQLKKTTWSDKTIKAYGKSLPEDEIRSIMGRAIPPEWTVNFVGTWKRTLEIQGSRRPAEHVPSAVAIRSAEADYCKNG
jgi:hypothetical protein